MCKLSCANTGILDQDLIVDLVDNVILNSMDKVLLNSIFTYRLCCRQTAQMVSFVDAVYKAGTGDSMVPMPHITLYIHVPGQLTAYQDKTSSSFAVKYHLCFLMITR